jgi:hypothetical protein
MEIALSGVLHQEHADAARHPLADLWRRFDAARHSVSTIKEDVESVL